MFTRPPSDPETSLPPYSPGYLAYPSGAPPSLVSEEARLFRERVKLHREKLQQEREELERAKAAQAAVDRAWEKEEETRRIRRAKLKEEALRAEIEWERMGGRARVAEDEDAELRRKLDDEANLTEEERTLKRSWEAYEKAWEHLAIAVRPAKTFTFRKVAFGFADMPWPVLRQPMEGNPEANREVELGDINVASIAAFLLHPLREPKKSRKETLREAMLRYHPDKLGRILPRIVIQDRVRVQEAVGVVMRCLNELTSSEN